MVAEQDLAMVQGYLDRRLEGADIVTVLGTELRSAPALHVVHPAQALIGVGIALWCEERGGQQELIGIAHDNRTAQGPQPGDDLTRVGTKTGDIAQADDLLDP